MNTFTYIFAAVGVATTGALGIYVVALSGKWVENWHLKRNRVHDDLNMHEDRLRDHLKRIEFLERCERDRNAAENKVAQPTQRTDEN